MIPAARRLIRFILWMDMNHTAIHFPVSLPPRPRRFRCHTRFSGWLGPALVLLLGMMTFPVPALADSAPRAPEFRQVPPLPGVREAAKAAGFQLEGFAAARPGKLRAGDAATALVT